MTRDRTLTASDVAKKLTSCAGPSPVGVTAGATTPVSATIDRRRSQQRPSDAPASEKAR